MTFDWWTLALQVVNFLILVWLLQHFLYKPIAGIIEKRRKQTDEVLGEAEKAKAEAEAAKQDFEARTAKLGEERRRVLDEAHEEIGKERAAAMDEARKEANELIAAAKQNIEKEKAEALKAMRGQIADLAGAMAAKLLDEAGRPVPSDVVLKALCEKIGALPKKEQDRLHRALAADGAAVTVVTAQPLGKADQAKWHSALGAALGAEARTEFKSEADLIGGAELRFPDAVVSLSWHSELAKLKGSLVGDEHTS